MFTTKSTIILGAGASFEYGPPLGAGLWGRIANDTKGLVETYEKYVASRVFFRDTKQLIDEHRRECPKAAAYFAEILDLLLDHSAIDAIMQSQNCAARFTGNPHAIMQRVAKRVVEENVHSSVDDFLRDNPSLLPPLRLLIAAQIFESLYERDDDQAREWNRRKLPLTSRFRLPHPNKGNLMVDNWLQRFVGACRPLLISAENKITPVSVISFNYDRLMETVLAHYWHLADRAFPPFSECFNFIYPYGCFSEFPEVVNEPTDWLREQAKGIGIANGEEGPRVKSVRNAVGGASQIFSLGFSFTETNIALLGLRPAHGKRLFVQNYGDNDTRLKRVLDRFPGAKSDPAPLAQLVSDGFFEQRGHVPKTIKREKIAY